MHSYRSSGRGYRALAVALVGMLAALDAEAQTPIGFYGGAGIGLANFSVEQDDHDYYYPYYGIPDYVDRDLISAAGTTTVDSMAFSFQCRPAGRGSKPSAARDSE